MLQRTLLVHSLSSSSDLSGYPECTRTHQRRHPYLEISLLRRDPSLRLYLLNADGTSKGSGVYHGSELTAVWGTSEDVTLVKNSQGLNEMNRFFTKTWSAFIRDPANGLKNFGWPLYDPHENTLVSNGKDGPSGATFGDSTACDDYCDDILAEFWEQ